MNINFEMSGLVLKLSAATVALAGCAFASYLMQKRSSRRLHLHPYSKHDGPCNDFLGECRKDPDKCFKCLRMSIKQFDKLHVLIENDVEFRTKFKTSLSSETRLAISLRYLGTGELPNLQTAPYKLNQSTVKEIIHETLYFVYQRLQPTYLPIPTRKEFTKHAEEFETQWNVPNCVGCLSGKRIYIKSGPGFSFQDYFTLVIMTVCDANYCFSVIDMHTMPATNYQNVVFESYPIGKYISECEFELPKSKPLPNFTNPLPVPYFFIGNIYHPLRHNLMIPYPVEKNPLNVHINWPTRRIFNYRISCSPRIIDNTFGILVATWQILQLPFEANEGQALRMMQACLVLHNFLLKTAPVNSCLFKGDRVINGKVLLGNWRDQACGSYLRNIPFESSRFCSKEAKQFRDTLADYFCETGAVNWQWDNFTL